MGTTRTRVALWLWKFISLARSRLCLYLPEPGCHQRKLWQGKYSFVCDVQDQTLGFVYSKKVIYSSSIFLIKMPPFKGWYSVATLLDPVMGGDGCQAQHSLHDTDLFCLYLFLRSLENWLSPVLFSPTCLEIYTLLLTVTHAF